MGWNLYHCFEMNDDLCMLSLSLQFAKNCVIVIDK